MKIVKVSEATVIQINWLVAKCEGIRIMLRDTPTRLLLCEGDNREDEYNPVEDWSQGGLVIQKLSIGFDRIPTDVGEPLDFCSWQYRDKQGCLPGPRSYGSTQLIAAMRCAISNKLGETAEVPDELS